MRDVDVRDLRRRLGLSRPKFAEQFGLCLPTLREWECGRRYPNQSALILLAVIARDPEVVKNAVRDLAAA